MNQVERLHYYNGGRLAAGDLAVEQQYHLAMRRLLNQGLFTPGVVNGLEVTKVDATHVRVAPGLALDPAGRELVVPHGPDEERTIVVPAQPPTKKAGGYFLVLRYAEERIPATEDPCLDPGTPQAARIRETPELLWTEDFPAHDLCDPRRPSIDCAVVLALVTTTAACEIGDIVIGVRQYARPTHVTQVASFALEGEKDIDKDNPKTLHFQIRGGAPNSVLLYLWGERFSSLQYTEIGLHDHEFSSIPLATKTTTLAAHTHSLGGHSHTLTSSGRTGSEPTSPAGHRHSLRSAGDDISGNPTAPGNEVVTGNFLPPIRYEFRGPGASNDFIMGGQHMHPFTVTLSNANTNTGAANSPSPSESHTHEMTSAVVVSATGSAGHAVRGGAAYAHFAGLRVELDGVDVTPEVVKKVPLDWNGELGNGTDTHGIVKDGTGPLDLIEIANAAGMPMDARPHTLAFRLGATNTTGGKVLYNLYVE